jgi:hypothetical protein
MILFRDYSLNVQTSAIEWLCQKVAFKLGSIDPQFILGAIGYSRMGTKFTALSKRGVDDEGFSVVLRFWAWGDGEQRAFDNLDRLFKNLENVLRNVSADAETRWQNHKSLRGGRAGAG